MTSWREVVRSVLLAALSGVLLALALPPYKLGWLGWFALVPLFLAAQGRRPIEAMGLGLFAGLDCGALHIDWAAQARGQPFAWIPFLFLALLLAVLAMAAGASRRRFVRIEKGMSTGWAGLRWAAYLGAAGVAAEWLTTFAPLPVHLAITQYRDPILLQLAAVTGIWGVSFLVWFVNAALADAVLLQCFYRPAFTAAALAWLLALGSGWAALAAAQGKGESLRVAAVQDHSLAETAHVLRGAALDGEEVDREALTRRAAGQGARLIVWSEQCLGTGFDLVAPTNDQRPTTDKTKPAVGGRRSAIADPTRSLAKELGVYLVVGCTEKATPKPFNVAAFVTPEGHVAGTHRKIHLFFGERQTTGGGREARAFDTPLGRVGLEICFDSCYTGITRRLAADGARLIAMPNYDPPTPNGILHHLHAAMLPFRAVENRVGIVRADATGCSQVIAPDGRVLGQSDLYVADALVRDLPLGDGRGTPFTRWGDWLAYLCVAVVGATLVARRTTSSDAAAPA